MLLRMCAFACTYSAYTCVCVHVYMFVFIRVCLCVFVCVPLLFVCAFLKVSMCMGLCDYDLCLLSMDTCLFVCITYVPIFLFTYLNLHVTSF